MKAYVRTTLDRVHGTDQKSEVFWASVRNKRQELMSYDEVQVVDQRDSRASKSTLVHIGRVV